MKRRPVTATDFYKNVIQPEGSRQDLEANRLQDPNTPPPDSAEKVAEHIIRAVESEEAEILLRESPR